MSSLLLTALVLFAGWIVFGLVLWWLDDHQARLSQRLRALESSHKDGDHNV
jgi:hypothetical protein